MKNVTQKTRTELPDKYKWAVDEMYAGSEDFEQDISQSLELADKLSALQGHLLDSPASLLQAMEIYTSAIRKIENALIYSRMKQDEDNSDTEAVERSGRASNAYTEISAKLSFFDPEILSAEQSVIEKYLEEEPRLGIYSHTFDKLSRQREHTLGPAEEYIMASLGEVTGSSSRVFTVLNNVDLDFGKVTDDKGIERDLSVSSYISLMESDSRDVRRNTYEAFYEEYKSHINTIASLYNYSLKRDTAVSKLRGYSSCMESHLSPDRIPLNVYDNLTEAVHQHLPAFHRYVGIRARLLNLDKLQMYDVYNSVVKASENGNLGRDYTFEEAVELACKALAPLGKEYTDVLRKGFLEEKWVDVYPNKGKTSGAYSFGSYDSKPFILMNFSGSLRDVFTLVHEGGHSMHSYYTRRNQPYIYGDHSIFTAEVASTVNEVLLINYLLDNTDDPEDRAYLLNFYIDEFKGTLFRQTMFAEFERFTHEFSEAGGTLTAERLCDKYAELNKDYYGPHMEEDSVIRYEWARIPHFYRAYYVYQYATGFSAANAIARKLIDEYRSSSEEYRSSSEECKALAGYKEFLKSGSSDYPVELLKIAGADMSSPEPVMTALDIFDKLVSELDEITRG